MSKLSRRTLFKTLAISVLPLPLTTVGRVAVEVDEPDRFPWQPAQDLPWRVEDAAGQVYCRGVERVRWVNGAAIAQRTQSGPHPSMAFGRPDRVIYTVSVPDFCLTKDAVVPFNCPNVMPDNTITMLWNPIGLVTIS